MGRSLRRRKRKKIKYLVIYILLGVVTTVSIGVGLLYLAFLIIDKGMSMEREKTPVHFEADEEGVFHIYDEADWLLFNDCIKNGYRELDAVLEEDINITGTSTYISEDYSYIGGKAPYIVRDYPYAGHLDGQGHKIEVGAARCSLFQELEAEGIIENLTLKVTIHSFPREGAGGIVESNYGTIRSCDVYGSVTGDYFVGGIAAVNMGTIEDCNNHASVTSLETGEAYEAKYDGRPGYGAGGIAGTCGVDGGEEKGAEVCGITGCCNYGDVTAEVYTGGIVAWLDDRTVGGASAGSVQELVQYEDFTTPSEEEAYEGRERESEGAALHYSLMNCTNYGTVTVNQRKDPRTFWYTKSAGICAELQHGYIYRCVNRGKIRFAEDAPQYAPEGYAYTNRPVAIADITGFAPTEKHHIIECVSLRGTIEGTMRHENIPELTEEELSAWEAGDCGKDHVSNNWEFDLKEAIDICGLEPLGVVESTASAERKNYYLCGEFALFLPDYMEIQEVFLKEQDDDACYALHIQVQSKEGAGAGVDPDDECWILCREADVQEALMGAKGSDTNEEWRVRYFMEELYGTIVPVGYWLKISYLNLPFHDCFQVKYVSGKRIYMENAIPDESLSVYMEEGDHELGNVIAMPLQGVSEHGSGSEDDLSAKWLMLFTRKGTNIRPSRTFVSLIEEGFYPLDWEQECYIVEEGDTLWDISLAATGAFHNRKMLADINGIADRDRIFVGDTLFLPTREEWEKRRSVVTSGWICSFGETVKEDG